MSAADWDLLADGPGQLAQAEARHRGDRRPEADARRHDAHAALHAGPHAGHDLDDHPGEGRRPDARRCAVGRHRLQLAERLGPLHHARPPGAFWYEQLRRTPPGASATSPRRRAPTSCSRTTPTTTARRRTSPRWRGARPGEPHPYVIGNDSVGRFLTVAEECAKAGPPVVSQQTTLPSTERILLGPGPSLIAPRVMRAMAAPVLSHLDPDLVLAPGRCAGAAGTAVQGAGGQLDHCDVRHRHVGHGSDGREPCRRRDARPRHRRPVLRRAAGRDLPPLWRGDSAR